MRALISCGRVDGRPPRSARSLLALVDSMVAEPGDFAAIAEQHRAHLLRVAQRLAGNAEVAKDLVQETLLRALRRFAQFESGTRVDTWLVTILTNLFYDYLKHQKVERKAEPELVALEPAAYEMTLATVADADLYAAVVALEPELREVVELCYLQQIRYREAAAILNVPLGTIGTRLMRARGRLRELLTDTKGRS